ncbi:hypothetical protein GCM10028803_53450 [Larkinella knui]|uniref:Uncharacterized protein n=1 Tax=Larkinella knui TaxID=2025310 RepID=A0A3P1CGY2_9BACT|nr:hypothetical protein [Larkinella knui]RRB12448.1 hypothetical protein EHT87_19815 [Larkinella knui]
MKKIELIQEGVRVECALATCYADLSRNGTLEVLKLAYCSPRTSETELRIWSLVFVAPPEIKKMLLLPLHRNELLRLLEQIDWAWKSGVGKKPLDAFQLKGTTYCLPDEELRLVTTGEFITAVTYLLAFSSPTGDNGQKADYLAHFLATICRPKQSLARRLKRDKTTWNGDEREAFNSYLIDGRAGRFRSVELGLQVAIMQWFLAAVGRAERLYNMPAAEKSDTPIALGSFVQDWEKTVHGLAREGNFGPYDAVMERSIHEVLAYLELRKIEFDEHESKNRD